MSRARASDGSHAFAMFCIARVCCAGTDGAVGRENEWQRAGQDEMNDAKMHKHAKGTTRDNTDDDDDADGQRQTRITCAVPFEQ